MPILCSPTFSARSWSFLPSNHSKNVKEWPNIRHVKPLGKNEEQLKALEKKEELKPLGKKWKKEEKLVPSLFQVCFCLPPSDLSNRQDSFLHDLITLPVPSSSWDEQNFSLGSLDFYKPGRKRNGRAGKTSLVMTCFYGSKRKNKQHHRF